MYVVVNTRSERPPAAVALDFSAKLLEAAQLDERAQKVDRIGAVEFTSQVLEQLVALGIDDQA
jgi:hypothetical protein